MAAFVDESVMKTHAGRLSVKTGSGRIGLRGPRFSSGGETYDLELDCFKTKSSVTPGDSSRWFFLPGKCYLRSCCECRKEEGNTGGCKMCDLCFVVYYYDSHTLQHHMVIFR